MMKTYAVNLSNKDFSALQAAGIKEAHTSISGQKCQIIKGDGKTCLGYIIRFRTKKDAVDFAIWAAGWIAAFTQDGAVPTITLLC
jgi:hypothetical protein